jgi:hypothetical protein
LRRNSLLGFGDSYIYKNEEDNVTLLDSMDCVHLCCNDR